METKARKARPQTVTDERPTGRDAQPFEWEPSVVTQVAGQMGIILRQGREMVDQIQNMKRTEKETVGNTAGVEQVANRANEQVLVDLKTQPLDDRDGSSIPSDSQNVPCKIPMLR